MKIIVLIILLFTFSLYGLPAQSLSDMYKKGVVKLLPDKEYAQHNDWDKVFETYYDTIYNRPMGNRKLIVMMPDHSIVVSHEYRNFYSLFDPDGKFVREFSITGESGKSFGNTKKIKGVINHHFFTELDNMGKMICCDFHGNHVKTLTLNYMTKDMIPLTDHQFAVVGWALWKDKNRDFVALVNYQTNEQKIIWDRFNDRMEPEPYTYPPRISVINNYLLIALPKENEIRTYDLNGRLISKESLEWSNRYMSVEDQKEMVMKRMEALKKTAEASGKKKNDPFIEKMLKGWEDELKKISTPLKLPAFSTIIKDSDENVLFFEIPEEEGANVFHVWVYKDGGGFICRSSFECEDYNLSITPDKMIFCDGYIYGLQTLKHAKGNPLRLVRFTLSN